MSRMCKLCTFTSSHQACKPQDAPNENSDPDRRNCKSKADDCSGPAINDFRHRSKQRY